MVGQCHMTLAPKCHPSDILNPSERPKRNLCVFIFRLFFYM